MGKENNVPNYKTKSKNAQKSKSPSNGSPKDIRQSSDSSINNEDSKDTDEMKDFMKNFFKNKRKMLSLTNLEEGCVDILIKPNFSVEWVSNLKAQLIKIQTR